ncbi:DUF2992 family protein [Methylobacterium sp. 88A]|uniref:DUF2992 family protein n=1 Tax=Methylobacterium sp. 88A TaxID=1131813 RepID=UPI0012F641ED|nr:DUF2992 family protein [Methylobacterium sp. 88A]
MHFRAIFLSLLCATSAAAGDVAYVKNWVDAQGGCRAALSEMQSISFGRQNRDEFLGKRFQDWSDRDINEFRAIYAECYAIANTPFGITPNPRNPNVLMFAEKRVGELQLAIGTVRSAILAQDAATKAQKRQALEAEAATAERIARNRAEEEASLAAQTEANRQRQSDLRKDNEAAEKLRSARINAARERAKHDEEVALEIERQAAAEESALSEIKKATEASRLRRQAAEQRLAQSKAAMEAQRQQQETSVTVAEENQAIAEPSNPPAAIQPPPVRHTPSAGTAAGCEKLPVRKLIIEEFNRAAEKNDLPLAIDLSSAQTDSFAIQGEFFTAACRYVVHLDNGKQQRFLLSININSLGSPYISIKPQGKSF